MSVRSPVGKRLVVLRLSAVLLVASASLSYPLRAQVVPVCDAARGESRCIGGWWLQHLGLDDDGRALWLLPHVDGVGEIFVAEGAPDGTWHGDLGSRFRPSEGQFLSLFNAATCLEELIDSGVATPRRRDAARLLAMYVAIHDGNDDVFTKNRERDAAAPFHLRRFLPRVRRSLREVDRHEVRERVRRHRELLARVERHGTCVPSITEPFEERSGYREYYRKLVADGYLDIAIVGGNLQEAITGRYQSTSLIESLRRDLDVNGFRAQTFRGESTVVLNTRVTQFFDAPIRVRIMTTSASTRDSITRRNVANFVESLAHADVVIFHGHSNLFTGSYYLSETKTRWSRFRIGLGHTQDLREKCHGLGEKPYQVLALQSCSSYGRYCRPLRAIIEEIQREKGVETGFLGIFDKGYFVDFVPRYGAFLRLLLAGRPPKDFLDEFDGIRPHEKTPRAVMRGFLQPSHSFIVPPGVEIVRWTELGEKSFHVVRGTGSDGASYFSTEIFAQNSPGEIVQVAAFSDGVYGLHRDGRVLVVGRGTGGAMVESSVSAKLGMRFDLLVKASRPRARAQLWLIDRAGELWTVGRGGRLRLAAAQAPRGTRFRSIGNDAKGRFISIDRDGGAWEWRRGESRFRDLGEEVPNLELSPSLRSREEGRLWTARARP
jgi:hypothetical protein